MAVADRDAGRDGDPVRGQHRAGLTNYDLVRSNEWQFIGLDNFADLLADPHTPTVVFNTIYLVIGTTVVCTRRRARSGGAHGDAPSAGIGLIRSSLPGADHDRAHRRRLDLAGDVQQRRRLDQLLPVALPPAAAGLARRPPARDAGRDHRGHVDRRAAHGRPAARRTPRASPASSRRRPRSTAHRAGRSSGT